MKNINPWLLYYTENTLGENVGRWMYGPPENEEY